MIKPIAKTVLIASLIILGANCKGKTENKDNTSRSEPEKEAQSTVSTAKPVFLTKADFLTKIGDYQTFPTQLKYRGDKPAVIDFYADWCGPCKTIAPYLDQLATEYGDKIYIYKIDVDKEQELAEALGIANIPTLYYVPMSGVPTKVLGSQSKSEIKNNIENLLLK